MTEQNSIRVIFTAKANITLDAIIKNYNLEETPEEFLKKTGAGKFSNEVVIDRLAKDFAIGKISEKDLINSLQKETSVPQQTAEKISREIINNIIPFLEKVPEEKLQDPAFVEELEKKLFGTANETKKITLEERDSVAEIIERKKQAPAEKFKKPIIQNPVPPTRQKSGPDSYREPIE